MVARGKENGEKRGRQCNVFVLQIEAMNDGTPSTASAPFGPGVTLVRPAYTAVYPKSIAYQPSFFDPTNLLMSAQQRVCETPELFSSVNRPM